MIDYNVLLHGNNALNAVVNDSPNTYYLLDESSYICIVISYTYIF